MIKTILFDLDGTLLPMQQETFVKAYFSLLAKKAANYGYEANKLIKTVWLGTDSMVNNKGYKSNEEVFWDTFANIYGKEALKDKHIFDEFYSNEFKLAKDSCGFNPLVKDVITLLKNKGYRLVLATNPIFPSIATETRINWAGINPSDFEIYTTYENSYHCKPNIEYYKDILAKINCLPQECLMVGNDVDEDMVASELGMQTFLLTDCLINKNNVDINRYNKGSFADFINYINK